MLTKYQKRLQTHEIMNKYSLFYEDIKIHRSWWAKYYWPFFMFRRLIFVMIPVVFNGHPAYQIQAVVALHSVYVLIFANVRPHWTAQRHMQEMFNECFLMLLFYVLVLFSKFNTNASTFYFFGYVYLILMGLVIAVNIGIMVYNTVKKLKRKNLVKKFQNTLNKSLELHKANWQVNWEQRKAKTEKLEDYVESSSSYEESSEE